jgi:gluconokinase
VSASSSTYIVSLDIGSSSVRALLYDEEARQVESFGAQIRYDISTSPDGGAEINPEKLAELTIRCLDQVHSQVRAEGMRPAAVSCSAFWHSFCGVDADGKHTTPILHLLDTRSRDHVSQVPDAHARTGCVAHTSYWPAKLLWLECNRSDAFHATSRWLSFPAYFFQKIFGQPRESTSMISGSGLWNLAKANYNVETLAALPVERKQLAAPGLMDEPERNLLPEYSCRWPAFDGIPWYPAIGDGAANHIGSGCVTTSQFSLMTGTTGAVRALAPSLARGIPKGLWCYCVDRDRLLMGGALSNGGNIFAWLDQTLALPADFEARLQSAAPGSHRLTVLPFLAGERSPYWRADLRGVIAGMSLATGAFEIAYACLEAVSLRFRAIYQLLSATLGVPADVIASGGALVHSPGWRQMIADALERQVRISTAPEASSRGAALLALERLGIISSLESLPVSISETIIPRSEFRDEYSRLAQEQDRLYAKVFEV